MTEHPVSGDGLEGLLKKRVDRRTLLSALNEAAKGGTALWAYSKIDPSVDHLLEAYQSGRRIARTIAEIGLGNEAVRELKHLDAELKEAETTLDQRSAQYRILHEKKKGVGEELTKIYDQNETFLRKAVTISRQLELMLGDLGNAGEAAKGKLIGEIDKIILDGSSKLAEKLGLKTPNYEEAQKRHAELNKYHQALKEAYKNDKDVQKTVTDFLTYLRDESKKSADQVKVIEENFPELAKTLRQNYDQMHVLEDKGAKATAELSPQVKQLRSDIEKIHSELASAGVAVRPIGPEPITGYTVLDRMLANTYTRHGLGTIAGMAAITGLTAMARAYLAVPLAAAKSAGGAAVYAAKKAREALRTRNPERS